MNILCYSAKFHEGFSKDFRRRLREVVPDAEIVFFQDRERTEQEAQALFAAADVIVGWFPTKYIKYCGHLRLIQLDIAGADGFADNPELSDDIVICNASGAYGPVIAEHAIGLLMAVCRGIPEYCESMREHVWSRGAPSKPIEDSSVLILGAGDIGTSIARFLRPMLGTGTITGVRRVRRAVPPEFDRMICFDELDEALSGADIVLCALPSTKETRSLLDERALRLMKRDAVLVNVGRGSLIPLDDLNRVLRDGHLFGVGLDVAEYEPLPPEHPIWDCGRIMITPHAAGVALSQDSPTYRRIYEIILENMARFAAGQPLAHTVDRATGYRKL